VRTCAAQDRRGAGAEAARNKCHHIYHNSIGARFANLSCMIEQRDEREEDGDKCNFFVAIRKNHFVVSTL
jgi:hypothetical protein